MRRGCNQSRWYIETLISISKHMILESDATGYAAAALIRRDVQVVV